MKKLLSILILCTLLIGPVYAEEYIDGRLQQSDAFARDTTYRDNIAIIFGTSGDFGLEFDSANNWLQLGDGTNDFLRVTDDGTTATFAFFGDGSFSANLWAATYGSDSS